jgi:hypothetical protein
MLWKWSRLPGRLSSVSRICDDPLLGTRNRLRLRTRLRAVIIVETESITKNEE